MDASPVVTPRPAASREGAHHAWCVGSRSLDSVLLLVSGVIGSSNLSHRKMPDHCRIPVPLFLGVWIAGPVISLACAAFAEMGRCFRTPVGNTSIYAKRMGDLVPDFLTAGCCSVVADGGTIAALAVGFAAYMGADCSGDLARTRGLSRCSGSP